MMVTRKAFADALDIFEREKAELRRQLWAAQLTARQSHARAVASFWCGVGIGLFCGAVGTMLGRLIGGAL
jgi:hypothetical protein